MLPQVQAQVASMLFQCQYEVLCSILMQLSAMRHAIKESETLRQHRIVGTSIAIVYDNSKAKVRLMDFANLAGREAVQRHEVPPPKIPLDPYEDEDGVCTAIENFESFINKVKESSEISPKSNPSSMSSSSQKSQVGGMRRLPTVQKTRVLDRDAVDFEMFKARRNKSLNIKLEQKQDAIRSARMSDINMLSKQEAEVSPAENVDAIRKENCRRSQTVLY